MQGCFVPNSVEIGPVISKRGLLKIFNIILIFSFEMGVALHLNKLETFHPRMLYAKFGSNWPNGSGEEDFLNILNRNLLFRYYHGEVRDPSFEQT